MLTIEQMKKSAPSIFATEPWMKMSDNYRFVPTIDVVNEMISKGFHPVKAAQARSRIEGKSEFTRHVIRFRHVDLKGVTVGDSLPEIVVMNSHDGSSSYKIMMGMFRMVCGNGLVVCSSMIDEINARHSGRQSIVQEVIDGSFRVIDNAPKILEQVDEWQHKKISRLQQNAYANAALELRNGALQIESSEALYMKREADRGDDIWHTFNRVQENMIRGGMQGTGANGNRRRARPIKSVNEDTKLNRALWRLTEELAKAA